MTTQPTEGLKPCPFCGGEAEEFVEKEERIEPLVPGMSMKIDVFVSNTYFGVRCPKCDVKQDNPYIEREYAVKAWNTRASQEQPHG